MISFRTVRISASALAFAFAFALAAIFATHATAARAADADDCDLASRGEIAAILGFPVEAPDTTSRAAGICFFTTSAISQEGSVTYAFVTDANLAQHRAFAAAQARRCAGVVKGAPNALLCAVYANVANASDLDAYFKARTSETDAVPVPSLGPGAIASPDALYVRRDGRILEVVVRLGEAPDVERETALAKMLLDRLTTP